MVPNHVWEGVAKATKPWSAQGYKRGVEPARHGRMGNLETSFGTTFRFCGPPGQGRQPNVNEYACTPGENRSSSTASATFFDARTV